MNKRELKTMLNTYEFVSIKFTKKDGTVRDMIATLVHVPPVKIPPAVQKLSEIDLSLPLSEDAAKALNDYERLSQKQSKTYIPEHDHLIRVVDSEKNEWRSIIIENIISTTPV